ncbi:MAG: hypothetical protein ACXW2F_06120, partial [Thermoanaerobaculia bacterium]
LRLALRVLGIDVERDAPAKMLQEALAKFEFVIPSREDGEESGWWRDPTAAQILRRLRGSE